MDNTSRQPSTVERFSRVRRLPIGTAIVATATGAVVMYGAFTAFGIGAFRASGSVQTNGAPVTYQSSTSFATLGLSTTRSPRTAAAIGTQRGIIRVELGAQSTEGIVTAAGVVLVVPTLDPAWMSGTPDFTVEGPDRTRLDAKVIFTDSSRGVVVLSAPELTSTVATTSSAITTGDTTYRRNATGGLVASGEVAAVINPWSTSNACWPIVYGSAPAGTVMMNARGDVVGLIAAGDPNPRDALVDLIPVTGWDARSECTGG